MENLKFLFVLIFIISIFSCRKDIQKSYVEKSIKKLTYTSKKTNESNKTISQINYELVDGRLKFENKEDFNDMLIGLDNEVLDDWEGSIGFTSYRTSTNMEEALDDALESETELNLSDRQLASVLNGNGIIQVSPFIFKLIPETRTVLVLDEVNISNLSLLQTSTTANNDAFIFEYSFDEDVFDELEAQPDPSSRTSARQGCNDKYARASTDKYNNEESCGWIYVSGANRKFKYWAKLDYNSAGINKKFFLDIKRRQRTHTSAWRKPWAATNVDFTAQWAYCTRCGAESTGECPSPQTVESSIHTKFNPYRTSVPGITGTLYYWSNVTDREYVFYRGTRSLKSYYARAQTKYYSCEGSILAPSTRYLLIEDYN
jgi:hypothetical protein